MTRVFTSAVVGLAVLIGVPDVARPGQAAAQFQRLWYQNYDEGVRAAQRGEWPVAIQALEAAKRSGPAPGRRVLFQGDRVDVFNPDYYLGLAYNATKRFGEAEAAFARVAAGNLIGPGDKLFDELRNQTALASYERLLSDGERALVAGRFADVEKALAAVVGSSVDDGRAAALATRAKEGAARVAAASAVNVEQRSAAPVYETVENRTATPDARASTPGLGPPVTNDPAPNPPPRTAEARPVETPPVTTSEPAATVAKLPPADAPATAREAIPSVNRTARAADGGIALAGATAYYQGQYEQAAQILSTASDVERTPVLTFYLACSRAALVASGRADASTLDGARAMYAAVRGATIDNHLRFISPRVRELLGDTAARAK